MLTHFKQQCYIGSSCIKFTDWVGDFHQNSILLCSYYVL